MVEVTVGLGALVGRVVEAASPASVVVKVATSAAAVEWAAMAAPALRTAVTVVVTAAVMAVSAPLVVEDSSCTQPARRRLPSTGLAVESLAGATARCRG